MRANFIVAITIHLLYPPIPAAHCNMNTTCQCLDSNRNNSITHSHRICCLLSLSLIEYESICFPSIFNTVRPRQMAGRHFADNTFKRILLNENVKTLLNTSLNSVTRGPINNIPCLFGAKPLSEPMMVSLLTYICVTRPQWVSKASTHWKLIADIYVNELSLFRVRACRPIRLSHHPNQYGLLSLEPLRTTTSNSSIMIKIFSHNAPAKCRLQNIVQFV